MKTTSRCSTQSSGTKKMGGHVAIVPSHSLAFWPVLTLSPRKLHPPFGREGPKK